MHPYARFRTVMLYKSKYSTRPILMQYLCLASELLCETVYYYSHFIDKDFQSSRNLEVLGLGVRFSCLQTPGSVYNTRRETGRRNVIDKGRRLEGVGQTINSPL